jgi:DNA polymerase III subunit delta
MQIRADQLEDHLGRQLAPLYVLHGDEPLLALEAQDAIRAKARAAGCTERIVFQSERGFDWSALGQAADAMSLFSERRLVELRIPTGKPGTEGAEAILRYCERLNTEDVTMVSLPRLSRADQSAAWFEALSQAGVLVNIQPVERRQLPAWIAARLARQGQRAGGETLEFMADAVEGNLLAAHQEIQKLGLLFGRGELDLEQVRQVVLDVSRHEAGDLGEAMLAGDQTRALRVLQGLRGEGEAAPRLVWVLAEELRSVAGVAAALRQGRAAAAALREHRVYGERRQAAVVRAARQMSDADLRAAVHRAARCERSAKGVGEADVWAALEDLVVSIGASLRPAGTAAPRR